MFTYSFNSETNFVEAYPKEDIYLKHVIEFYTAIKEDNELPGNLKLLIDATGKNIYINPKDISKVKRLIDEITEKYENVNIAIIHTSPMGVVIATLMGRIISINLKAFSTRKAAIQWLSKS